MRLSHSLIFAGALFVGAPVLAQDNAAVPANSVSENAVDANGAAAAPATTTADMNAIPATDATAAPAETTAPADTAAPAEHERGFPWGVLGIVGLIGLFGVRKVKG
jgi:hypothetical protein